MGDTQFLVIESKLGFQFFLSGCVYLDVGLHCGTTATRTVYACNSSSF